MKLILLLLVCIAIKLISGVPSFYIDYDSNTFVKDGKPFKYVSGSVHSYRIPRELWHDRLYKMWAAGLNAIETYVFWNEHEQEEGVYNFDGQYNIFEFIELAQKIGFVVVLRPGPYICGEHEYGGLPWWLLKNGTDTIIPRSSETNYMNAVNRWFSVFLPKVVPYLYKNGGPIITVQVENEYGAYFTCDTNYRNQLRDLFRKYLGDDVVLFTTDGYPFERIGCGVIDNVYSTIDFGVDKDVNETFEIQRKYSPKGPLVNSEFYPGWLDFWGQPHQKRDTKLVIPPFEQILRLNASVNFYMFHGGTNFGFSAGAHPPYLVQPTSYDYDAPISEAGDITQKYLAIKDEISKYYPVPNIPLPKNSTKIGLGKVKLNRFSPLFLTLLEDCLATFTPIASEDPLSFEKLGQGYGVVLYFRLLDDANVDGKVLSIPGLRDRAYIQIGSNLVGILDRVNSTELKINLPNNKDKSLVILVENTGRLCYGDDLLDAKGIISDVILDGKVLKNWCQCPTNDYFPYYQMNTPNNMLTKYKSSEYSLKETSQFNLPGLYVGEIGKIPDNNFDTFLKLDLFSKGMAFIDNGNVFTNLGRYWPAAGPQITLYTPGVFFSTNNTNLIYVVDFEGSKCTYDDCYVEFIDYPIIDNL